MIMLLLSSAAVAAEKKKDEELKDNPYVLMELFGHIYKTIKKEYVEEPTDRKLVENAIQGMLSSLDPHSSFMNQDDYEEMETMTKGEFGGLGIEVTSERGLVRVITPIDDTPAFKAGIKAGDFITHINDEAVVDLSLNEAVKKMRGKPGTTIKIKISRKNEKPFDVKIVRAIIQPQPVKYEAKNNIGYIRIASFNEKTVDKTHEAVNKLTSEIGAEKLVGFVIDVRNNPGGLLDAATGVVDTFISQGEIVSTRSRDPKEVMRLSAKTGDMTNGKPLVVLINQSSASASEIVAGALQDHKRALIVGTKSFGKGSVQAVKGIPGFGGIKMTVARYYTPSGRCIQAKGIEPDIEIPQGELKEDEVIRFGEGDLHGALAAEEGKKASEVKQKEAEEKNKEEDKSSDEKEEKKDYQLDRAMDILKAIALVKEI